MTSPFSIVTLLVLIACIFVETSAIRGIKKRVHDENGVSHRHLGMSGSKTEDTAAPSAYVSEFPSGGPTFSLIDTIGIDSAVPSLEPTEEPPSKSTKGETDEDFVNMEEDYGVTTP